MSDKEQGKLLVLFSSPLASLSLSQSFIGALILIFLHLHSAISILPTRRKSYTYTYIMDSSTPPMLELDPKILQEKSDTQPPKKRSVQIS